MNPSVNGSLSKYTITVCLILLFSKENCFELLKDFKSVTVLLSLNMSDSDDQATKKKLKIKDDQSAGCSKMSNMHAQCLRYETQSACNIAAERSLLYQEQHQEEINQRRRDISERQQNLQHIPTESNVHDTDEIEQITQATSNTQLSSNSHAQKQKRYYERHKAEINKRKREKRLKQNIPQWIPFTAAERSLLYRARHREEINQRRKEIRQHQQNLQEIPTVSNVQDTGEIEQITQATSNTLLSSNSTTQKQQQYYENHEEINKRKTDSRLKQNIPQWIPFTAAERSLLYRARHREEINQRRREIRQRQRKLHKIHAVSNVQNTDEIEQVIKATSKNQLRQRRYYERHKEEINKRKREKRLKQNISQSIPATAAERSRKYRERNRQEINERLRYSRLCQKILQGMHTECNINNVDDIEQITEATPNDQESLNSSDDDIIQEMTQILTSFPQQHNTQHFEETQNDRVQTTT